MVAAMMKNSTFARVSLALSTLFAVAANPLAYSLDGAEGRGFDVFDAGEGELKITFLGHASLVFEYKGQVVYVDPVGQYGDFRKFPGADLILVTHEHADHLDPSAIGALKRPDTRIILPEASRRKLGEGEALGHGSSVSAKGIGVEAVPAYNSSSGKTNYHPKSRGDNGYMLTFCALRIYVAGDTEPMPEMSGFGRMDIAFLPMNQPYTMTPDQAAAAARMLKPRILYPYHFSQTDTSLLVRNLKDEKSMEVRLRDLQ